LASGFIYFPIQRRNDFGEISLSTFFLLYGRSTFLHHHHLYIIFDLRNFFLASTVMPHLFSLFIFLFFPPGFLSLTTTLQWYMLTPCHLYFLFAKVLSSSFYIPVVLPPFPLHNVHRPIDSIFSYLVSSAVFLLDFSSILNSLSRVPLKDSLPPYRGYGITADRFTFYGYCGQRIVFMFLDWEFQEKKTTCCSKKTDHHCKIN